MELLVSIGKVGKPHGVKGHFRSYPFSGEVDHFLALRQVFLADLASPDRESRPFEVEDVQVRGRVVLLKLREFQTPEAARLYCGAKILVPASCGAPLKEGEYYQRDLCGCALLYRGERLGEVLALVEGGQEREYLEVKTQAERLCYVPFERRFVGEIDLKNKRIELKERWILE